MKTPFVVVIMFTSAVAGASVEIGGTAGLHAFSKDNELGVVDDPNATSLEHGPLFGLRLGIYGSMIGVEAEGGVIMTKPRSQPEVDVYAGFARGDLVLQFRAGTPENTLIPFILAGGGVVRVVKWDDSAFTKDMDPMAYAGLGMKFRGNGWGLRLEGRVVIVPSSASTRVTQDFEGLASLYIELGRRKRAATPAPVEPPPEEPPPTSDPDKDVAVVPPTPLDADKDGVVDGQDKCEDQAEDKDGFQDDDGCPDPDNDNDGVFDADDKCGDQPETKNAIADDDGCPDDIPADLAPFLGPIAGVSFKPNTAAFAGRSTKVLDKVAAAILPSDVKLEIQAHTDDAKPKGKLKTNDALSQARADAVKAYLVKKGVDASRFEAKGYAATEPIKNPKGLKGKALKAARAKNARIEFKIIP
jgi:outer membrane protein OmpA-like peptidoglycan-associated protein